MQKISSRDYWKIKKTIIRKLYAKRAFARGHMLFEHLHSGVPSHLLGAVKRVLDDLQKEGIVLHYGNTKHGNAYQLNIHKLKEIEELLV